MLDNSFHLEDLCQGDERSWHSFYQTHAPLVKRILAWPKWRFSREEQDDMLQEVFISLMKSIKNYKGEAKISTFLAQITQNQCVSAIRKRLTHKRGDGKVVESIDLLHDLGNSGEMAVADRVISAEEERRMQEAVGKLEPECRELVRFRFVEDLSYQALSDRYGQPIGTLASRLKRCLLLLRKIYEGKSGETSQKERLNG